MMMLRSLLPLGCVLATAVALPVFPSDIPVECYVTWTPPGQSPSEPPPQPIQCRPLNQPDHCPQETKDLDKCPPGAFTKPIFAPPPSEHVDQKPPPVAELPPDEVQPEAEVIVSPPEQLKTCLLEATRNEVKGFCLPSIKLPQCSNEDWDAVTKKYPDTKHTCEHHIHTRDVSERPSEYFDCYRVTTNEDGSKVYCLPKTKPNTCAADEWQEVNEKAPKEHRCVEDNTQNKEKDPSRDGRQIQPPHGNCYVHNNDTNTFCKPDSKPRDCADKDWNEVINNPQELPCKKPDEDGEEEHSRRKRQDDSLRDDESVQLIEGHKKCVRVEKPPPTPEEIEKTEFCLPKDKLKDCPTEVLDKIKKVFTRQCNE